MQADLGSAVSNAGAFVGYTYGARYVYTDTVILNDNFLRVSACEDAYQTPLTSAVITVPATRPVQYKDRMGNPTHRVRLSSPHRDLTILAVGSVRLDSPPSALEEVALANLRYDTSADEFLSSTPMVHPNMVADMARQIIGGNTGDPVGNGAGLLETVDGIVSWVYENITYIRGSTTVATTAEQVLGTRQGVCQDMTHLAMGMLRALGIPARYVSGLMCGQVGETHAWLEFLHPTQGWLPSDPTRGQSIARGADLVKFAVGRDYTQASPIEGSFVSKGTGWLDVVVAQASPSAESVSFDDAMSLIENAKSA